MICERCKVHPARDGGKLCAKCRKRGMEEATLAKHDELTDAMTAIEQAATTDQPAHGLGDKVAVVAKAFGFVQTPGCGCQQRQENLNYVNFNQSPVQVAKDIWNALRVKKGGP